MDDVKLPDGQAQHVGPCPYIDQFIQQHAVICRATREALGGFESKEEAQDIRIEVLASRIEALEAQLAERDAPLLLRIVRSFLRFLFGRGRWANSPEHVILALLGSCTISDASAWQTGTRCCCALYMARDSVIGWSM